MNTVKLPNQQVIDAICVNDMTKDELAQVIRQVYRVIEMQSKGKDTGQFTVAAILNNLTLVADSIEEFL